MPDTFGLLELPGPVPATGEALGDPALDLVLAFAKAVINADCGAAWAARNAADPVPCAYTFAHNPDLESFNANETPALYMWRGDDNGGVHKVSQDVLTDESGFQALWVPPPMPQEHKRERESFRNLLKKSLRAAFAQGRHPAWVLPGDDYHEPEDYGSVLLFHAKLGKCRLAAFRAHTLVLESEDRSGGKTPFECLFFTLDTMETFSFDPTGRAAYPEAENVQGTVNLPEREDQEEPLEVSSFVVDPTLLSIDPAEGPEAGGTAVVISGRQFADDSDDADIRVFFGDEEVDADDIELLDESSIAVVSPAGTGVVDVRVVFPSGVEKTLSGAFEYV